MPRVLSRFQQVRDYVNIVQSTDSGLDCPDLKSPDPDGTDFSASAEICWARIAFSEEVDIS